MAFAEEPRRPAETWELHRTITPKLIAILLVVAVALAFSARHTELDEAAYETGKAVLAVVGVGESNVISGAVNFLEKAFPIAISSKKETSRLDAFDPDDLPMFAYVETVQERDYDALTNTFEETTTEYLVRPFGYLEKVLWKMVETIEMAFWGTVLSIVIAIPLGYFGAKNYARSRLIYGVARAICSFNRAMPELILALFFVLMYGFGPIAGVLALGLHTSGFLGKFFADEIENADPGPQKALRTTGASKLKVLRYAVLPQVLPQYYAYVQYIMERNIRSATVLGIVGAGGIGTELKGRWDIFDYDHVATILLVIFLTVVALEFVTQRLRSRAI